MRSTLFLDFETAFSTSDRYDLKSISIREYVLDSRFKVHGAAVAFGDATPVWFSGEDLDEWLRNVDWANTSLVNHNSKFDAAILAWRYGYIPRQYVCTQSMSRAVNGYTIPSHSLAKLAINYGFPEKGEMKTNGLWELTPQQEQELATYCIRDVEISQKLYFELESNFPDSEYEALDWTIRVFTQPKLVLNTDTLIALHKAEKERRESIFDNIGIPKATFASNDKFPALLKERGYDVPMKLSPKKKEADGRPKLIPALALGDEDFQAMLHGENEELAALCEARVAAKSTLLETRAEKFIAISKLGAFPFDVQYSGAQQTHRFSGGSGGGGNPQNLHRKGGLRQSIEAPKGHLLLVGDFAAIEARIVAWLAEEPELMRAFTNDEDVYCSFASLIYGRAVNKAEHPAERGFGKEGILGLGYSMGWEKFKKRVKLVLGKDISEQEAKDTVSLYRSSYKRIPQLWSNLQDALPLLLERGSTYCLPGIPFIQIHNGALILPSGLRLQYPLLNYTEKPSFRGRMQKEWTYRPFRKGRQETHKLYGGKMLENICQALAGEICKEAIIKRCERNGLSVMGQCHDELIAVVKEADAWDGEAIMKKAMEDPVSWLPSLKLKAEIGMGDNWQCSKN